MSDQPLPDPKFSNPNNYGAVSVETLPEVAPSDPRDILLPSALTVPEPEVLVALPDLADQADQLDQSAQSPSRRRWRGILLILILGATIAAIALIRRQGESANPDSSTAETTLPNILPATTITVAPVSTYSVSQSYTGVIEAERTSELSFEQPGLLMALQVEEGAAIAPGEIIARLDTRQLEAQRSGLLAQRDQARAVLSELENGPRQETIAATQAQLAQEKARLRELQTGPRSENIDAAGSRVQDLQEQLELAQLQTQRRQALYQEGAISQEQFDQVATQEDSIQARLGAARSELEELQTGTRPEQIQAQQAQVQAVRSQLDELVAGTRREQIEAQQAQIQQIEAQIAEIEILIEKNILRAPFPGTVSLRYLDEGTVVSPGQAVVRLVEDSRLKARIGVPPSVISRLTPGRQYPVEVNGDTYDATVLSILPELDSATRTQTAILALPPTVVPGAIARLEIDRSQSTEGYWLPTSALVRGERGLWACYALVAIPGPEEELPRGTAQIERRTVEVLYTEGDRSLVRGMLQPGDQVVKTGTQQFVPGQFVRGVEES
ncbi:MAG: efflux RND transporter periplasmic adaptor subunit [Oscillatoriales cyanobacterium RM2_1_1]|nr:efflux RND transporter periplasmic adaptor subunit [Oscillatoriales cyanobacterium RM2_1_1]